ncbi:MAG: hypothetical protein MRZ79_07720 [Bacteroidia bacterium]|nr:hypothetical protein [Bacteroidia bacterium]
MIRNESSVPLNVQLSLQELYPLAEIEDWQLNDWGTYELCFEYEDEYVVAYLTGEGEWIMSDHFLTEEDTPYFIDYYLEELSDTYFSAVVIFRRVADGDPFYLLEIEPEDDLPPIKIKFDLSGLMLNFWQMWREEVTLN